MVDRAFLHYLGVMDDGALQSHWPLVGVVRSLSETDLHTAWQYLMLITQCVGENFVLQLNLRTVTLASSSLQFFAYLNLVGKNCGFGASNPKCGLDGTKKP